MNTGAKHDQGKPLAGCLLEFPRALQAVANVATFGAAKYSRSSWQTVPDARQRYMDAAIRHLLAAQVEDADKESGLDHLAHLAWNILAVVELMERERE